VGKGATPFGEEEEEEKEEMETPLLSEGLEAILSPFNPSTS
jgi:hypothetical protein